MEQEQEFVRIKRSKKYYPLNLYNELKVKYPRHILFIQVGCFYETFGDDARDCHTILGWVLFNWRNKIICAGSPCKSLEFREILKAINKPYLIIDQIIENGLLTRQVTEISDMQSEFCMNEIIIKVKGKPIPWANNNKGEEVKWREDIRDECRKNHANQFIKEDVKLKVEIIFSLKQKRISKSDLDNLAKPVLDTICKINNPQRNDSSITGCMFNHDDNRIYELNLKKVYVVEDGLEGAIIKITKLVE